VRAEAARGLELMEGDESALLLRLKARLGDDEAPVVGQVFDSLLKLEQDRGIRFVAGFLKSRREVREEAALSLGSSRLSGAVEILRETWESTRDPEFREVILRALSVSRQEPALEFLLSLVREARAHDAKAALEALSLDRNSPEIRRRVEEAAVRTIIRLRLPSQGADRVPEWDGASWKYVEPRSMLGSAGTPRQERGRQILCGCLEHRSLLQAVLSVTPCPAQECTFLRHSRGCRAGWLARLSPMPPP
jgi:hypothetical protein